MGTGARSGNGLFYKLAGCSTPDGIINPNLVLPSGQTCRVALSHPTDANPLRVYPPGLNKLTFNNFSPKAGVQIHPVEDVMIYGSWSEGYKTGGWTTRVTTPQTVASNYLPEKATTFEVGLKTRLFDRKLQINAALFTTRYTGIQLNYQVGSSPTIANVGDARIKGFELEVVAQPTRHFSISGSVGYLHARYTSLDPAVAATSGPSNLQAGALVGGPLPKTPEWKINVSPRLEIPLSRSGTVVVLGDWTHTSSMSNNVERTFVMERLATDIFSASVAFTEPSDRYTLTIGGTNLSDERYVASGSAIIASGAIAGTYNRPREWYARLGARF